MNSKKLLFPKGFLWGTASSAYQTEGNNRHSDWWAWEKQVKNTLCGSACRHYDFYKKDFEIAKKILNNNAHRLSIEWSRIEPQENKFNSKEIKHYREVLKNLKSQGLKTFVTLHHFTFPLWFSQKGAFNQKENLQYFTRYVQRCVQEFGDLTDYWLTINEPNVYVFFSHLLGSFPPQKKSLITSIKILINIARAHREAYKVIHKQYPNSPIGACIDYVAYIPRTKNLINLILVKFLNFIGNDLFNLLTKNHHDYIGVNYYFNQFVSFKDIFSSTSDRAVKAKVLGEEFKEDLSIYPKGIYDIVMNLKQKFKIPIYITENGVAGDDQKRIKYIKNHLEWVHKAIKNGADVRGYFYWSLLDNFEWTFGFEPRFGLIGIDYQNYSRTPRQSAYYYGEICARNALVK